MPTEKQLADAKGEALIRLRGDAAAYEKYCRKT
jgi:hypothetical protein